MFSCGLWTCVDIAAKYSVVAGRGLLNQRAEQHATQSLIFVLIHF